MKIKRRLAKDVRASLRFLSSLAVERNDPFHEQFKLENSGNEPDYFLDKRTT